MKVPTPLLRTQFGNHRLGWRIIALPPFDAVHPMLQQAHALTVSSPGWAPDGAIEILITRKLTALNHGIRDLEAMPYNRITDMGLLSLARAISIAVTLDPANEAPVNNNRFEMLCWLQTLISKLTERRAGDVEAMTERYRTAVELVLGECVELGEIV